MPGADDRFKEAAALLAEQGSGRLVSLMLVWAGFVLPLYEIHVPGDDRPRRALRRDRLSVDWQNAMQASDDAFYSSESRSTEAKIASNAAAAVATAAHTATRLAQGEHLAETELVLAAHRCLAAGTRALHLAEIAGSAQERLDWRIRMEGHTSFEALLSAWLVEPERVWTDRLAQRIGDVA